MKKALIFLCVMAVAGASLVVSGCGSSSEESAGPAPKAPETTQLPSQSKPGMLGEPKLNPNAGTNAK